MHWTSAKDPNRVLSTFRDLKVGDFVVHKEHGELLEESIRELPGEEKKNEIEPETSLKIAASFFDAYLPDISERINIYRRLSTGWRAPLTDVQRLAVAGESEIVATTVIEGKRRDNRNENRTSREAKEYNRE